MGLFTGERGPKICPECRAEIDPLARRCRYCGSKIQHWQVTSVLGALIAVGIFTYACAHVADSLSSNNAQSSAGDQTWLEQHKNDPKGLDDRFGDHAQAACSTGADDYLRTIAANDFAWDDDTKGLLGTRFTRIMTTSEAPYVLTLVSHGAKLSNAFGAFSHIDLYCSFDAKSGNVRSYSTMPPPLNPATDTPQKQAAPSPKKGKVPASDAATLEAIFLKKMADCQGSEDNFDPAVCKERDAAEASLRKIGICWEYSDWRVTRADYDFHDCTLSAPPGYRFDPALANDDWSPAN